MTEWQDSPWGRTMARFAETLDAMGYAFEVRAGGQYVSRMDDSPWERRFTEGLTTFIGALDGSPTWRLDLQYGSVDFDRTSLMVTPHDGSDPFSARHPLILGWGGGAPVGDTPASATELYLTGRGGEFARRDQLPFGGAWYKWI